MNCGTPIRLLRYAQLKNKFVDLSPKAWSTFTTIWIALITNLPMENTTVRDNIRDDDQLLELASHIFDAVMASFEKDPKP
ncbi:MAG: hypothetical protein JSS57_00770 [Proteobacteria bacterium]|nr:hypothetical protein [Pseudomonadota bacterium]